LHSIYLSKLAFSANILNNHILTSKQLLFLPFHSSNMHRELRFLQQVATNYKTKSMRLPCHWLHTKLHLSKRRNATYLRHIKYQSHLFSHITHIANNHINSHRVFRINNHQRSIISNHINMLSHLNLIAHLINYNRLPLFIK